MGCRGDISVCALSLDALRCLRAGEFVRIKSAEAEVIDFVAGALGIRDRDVWSAGRMRDHDARR
ncbi:hypothetical protein BO443_40351 [Burkholderia orbicola]